MPPSKPVSDPPVRRARATGRVTLADVAQAAGVSPITVSRALRGERSVAQELCERVQAAATALGYVPDPAARALASSRSSHVAVLIPKLSNTLFVELLDAVQNSLVPAGYQTLIGVTHYDAGEEEAVLRSFLAHRPAGLIVTGRDRSPAAAALIEGSGVPCVHVMEVEVEPGSHSVGFSQREAGRAITQHLLDRGRSHIAYVAAQLDPRTLERGEGYAQALAQAGLADRVNKVLSAEPSSMALGAVMLERVLREAPDTDAIFFCNDDLAQGALLAALRQGVAVPGRVAVAGFNDLPGSDQMVPPLTTVATPRREIGEQAAQMLMKLMRGLPVEQPNLDLGFQVIRRASA
ncbi:LacI family gluconate utilization system Gnt-I transcriptional repressor [Pelomonas aquatica]|uniref:LacI family gluconate utilization system Gnt-I transcriptional repressor n=1 Tax=Pelomonas aquatica TaxID=431058 RepID=A0ABU1Z3F5_9BURK|nr:LacI family DNA-binding transcriptional regulator [Pelomonas aquatica]MDR7294983.1 LacI family gluconate utilization system Gnt-I transcriptional repressor [Pelomonas aquatica]